MDYRKEFRIDPDTKFKLHKLDPAFTGKHETPDEAKKETEVFAQEKLFVVLSRGVGDRHDLTSC